MSGNDGGQAHNWPHHNGAVADAQSWHQGRGLYNIADILAFEDQGSYLYVAGDCTRAYAPEKLECFTRQIVFLRPGTFVVFDRAKSTRPDFRKTWLLQAMKTPAAAGPNLVVTNGNGRLHIQTVLPVDACVELVTGDALYSYGGQDYPPARETGPAPSCRVEVSPPTPAKTDYFLHVLTATDAAVDSVPLGRARTEDGKVTLEIGEVVIAFTTAEVGGSIRIGGRATPFAREVASHR